MYYAADIVLPRFLSCLVYWPTDLLTTIATIYQCSGFGTTWVQCITLFVHPYGGHFSGYNALINRTEPTTTSRWDSPLFIPQHWEQLCFPMYVAAGRYYGVPSIQPEYSEGFCREKYGPSQLWAVWTDNYVVSMSSCTWTTIVSNALRISLDFFEKCSHIRTTFCSYTSAAASCNWLFAHYQAEDDDAPSEVSRQEHASQSCELVNDE